MLCRIFSNIRENLIDEKYRTLKKSNAKILQLTNYKEVAKVLTFGGFEEKNPGFVLTKINIGHLDECIEQIG
jgi:hypothetical protein